MVVLFSTCMERFLVFLPAVPNQHLLILVCVRREHDTRGSVDPARMPYWVDR